MFFFFWDPSLAQLQTANLKAFTAGIDIVRKRYPSMTVGQLHTLLTAATSGSGGEVRGLDLRELADSLDLPYSTVTRHSDVLGAGVGQKGGLGLIEKQPVPGQKKNKAMVLSASGKLLLTEIDRAMSDRTPASPHDPTT